MKKIIGLTTLLLCMSLASFAQSAIATAKEKQEKSATCKPASPEACAKKMGISLTAYQALPKKNCSKTAASSTAIKASNAAPVVAVSNSNEKKCCGSLEECAKKMGMTVEECKATCKSSMAQTAAQKDEKLLLVKKE